MSVPLSSALEYLLRPVSRHRNDESAAAELNVCHAPLGLPPGLTLQWLGTAGFALGYEGSVVLIDPYLTRPKLARVFGGGALRSSQALVDAHVPRADAILAGHTHFDHALDLPTIARSRGARVYGSRSAVHLMRMHGLEAQCVEVEPRRVYEVGPFTITFVETLHSKLALGLAVPFDGEFTCDHLDDLHAGAYRSGQVFAIHIAVAGVTFYHQGSANLLEDRIQHRNVDYFLAGISGRGFTPDYTGRILRALSPRVIVPQHYDDFFRPLGAQMGFSLNVNFGGFVEEVARVSRDFRIQTLSPLQVAAG